MFGPSQAIGGVEGVAGLGVLGCKGLVEAQERYRQSPRISEAFGPLDLRVSGPKPENPPVLPKD